MRSNGAASCRWTAPFRSGLGLVEGLIAAFGAFEVSYVGVRLAAVEVGRRVARESDATPAEADLPQKVMRGLANQLGAESLAARAAARSSAGGFILNARVIRHARDAQNRSAGNSRRKFAAFCKRKCP